MGKIRRIDMQMELKKIIISRKLIWMIMGLLIIQTVIFWLDCDQKDMQWKETYHESYSDYLEEEQRQYNVHYQEKIQTIVKQADSMEEISIFAKKDSFSQRNSQLTKKAFEPLGKIVLANVTSRTIVDFFSFRMGNICVVLCAIAISIYLSEITRGAMRSITFTMAGGKLGLAISKKTALGAWAFILNFVFLCSLLLEGAVYSKENPIALLGCPVQSFLCFAEFTWKLSLFEALLLYLIYRTFITYVLMILTWSLCLICNHTVLSIGIGSVVFTLEYCLYTFIDENHAMHLLKFCNIWYWAFGNDYFLKYKNVNIMGYAVGRNTIILIALLVADVIGAIVGIYIWCTRYPHSSKERFWQSVINRMQIKIEQIRGGILEKFSLTGIEAYKVLVGQKGLIAILLLVGLLVYRADFTQIQWTTQQKLYYEFIERNLGVPCRNSYQEIESINDKMVMIDQIYTKKLLEETEDGKTNIELALWYESFDEERAFLQQIKEQTAAIESITAETGILTWYVNQYSYHHLLQEDDVFLNIGLLIVMLWICFGVYLREKQSGTLPLINCSINRNVLYRRKSRVVVVISSFVFLSVLVFELVTNAVVYGMDGLGAPVQSILELSDIPFPCTIWQYFLVKYCGRYMLYILMCLVVCKMAEYALCKKELKNGTQNKKHLQELWGFESTK